MTTCSLTNYLHRPLDQGPRHLRRLRLSYRQSLLVLSLQRGWCSNNEREVEIYDLDDDRCEQVLEFSSEPEVDVYAHFVECINEGYLPA